MKKVNLQTGATLFVGLILLIAISVISLAAMRTSILDLIIATNKQQFTYTFESSEQVINQRLSTMSLSLSGTPTPNSNMPNTTQIDVVQYPNSSGQDITVANVRSNVCFRNVGLALGYDLTNGSAYHFQLNAVADAPARGANAQHRLGFFIIGPGAPPPTGATGPGC